MADGVDALLLDQAGQLGLLGLLQAITSDKENASRIASLRKEQETARAMLVEAQAQESKNEQILAEARVAQTAAEQKTKLVDEREKQLREWEARIGGVSDALSQEKQTWEAMRQKIDEEQAEREARLAAHEETLAAAQQKLATEQDALREASVEAEKVRTDYHARHERLTRALDLNQAFDDGKGDVPDRKPARSRKRSGDD